MIYFIDRNGKMPRLRQKRKGKWKSNEEGRMYNEEYTYKSEIWNFHESTEKGKR